MTPGWYRKVGVSTDVPMMMFEVAAPSAESQGMGARRMTSVVPPRLQMIGYEDRVEPLLFSFDSEPEQVDRIRRRPGRCLVAEPEPAGRR